MIRYIVDYFVARSLWNWTHRAAKPEPQWIAAGQLVAVLLTLIGLAVFAVLIVAFLVTSI